MSFSNSPAATDDPEELADWLELEALESGGSSRAELVSALKQGGTVAALLEEEAIDEDGNPSPPHDPGSARAQRVADDAFSEIEGRARACGGRYPFEIGAGSMISKGDLTESPYVFLMLLSLVGPTSGHRGTAVLFESLCAAAAQEYVSGRGYRFGAPRPAPLTRFGTALDDLCASLGEGGGTKPGEGRNHTGDGGLDLVAWRPFPDGRCAKLIAFGQCAAGKGNYESKLNELDGAKFVKKYFRTALPIDPIRFFFVPWRLRSAAWEKMAIDGGVIFDRCRIVALLSTLGHSLLMDLQSATRRMMRRAFDASLAAGHTVHHATTDA